MFEHQGTCTRFLAPANRLSPARAGGEIARQFRNSCPALHHLRVLKDTGSVQSAKRGQEFSSWLKSQEALRTLTYKLEWPASDEPPSSKAFFNPIGKYV